MHAPLSPSRRFDLKYASNIVLTEVTLQLQNGVMATPAE